MDKKFEFDYLREWHLLSDDELRVKSKSRESQEKLKLLIEWLGDANDKKEIISEEAFPELAHRMYIKMVDGSKSLGKAIIESADYSNEGRVEDAVRVFNEFIKNCPSEFYIKIARVHLKDLAK